MAKPKTDLHPLVLLLIIGLGIFLAYQLVLLLINVFVYAGYNGSFFFDNLLAVGGVNPAVTWGFFGLLIGACVGVGMAVRKYKLAKNLLLYPIGALVLFITVMGFVNKPTGYPSSFNRLNSPETSQPSAPQEYFTVNQEANVRTLASTRGSIIFVLPAGAEVEILQRGYLDTRNAEWAKIRYQGQEGYVSMKLVSTNYRY